MTDSLRRGRGLDRVRRQGRRADEGLDRQGPTPRDDRRHRWLRRSLRRVRAHVVPPSAARHLDRRGRHQGRHRPGDGRPRHDRLRPGRHGRRRPGRVRRRAVVHDRLHRLRTGGPRADRGHRQGDRRGVRRGRVCARRRRDRRAPRAPRARRLRRRRCDHGCRRGRRPARAGPGPARRRGAGDGVQRAALQRLLAGAARVPALRGRRRGRLGARPRRTRARPHPRRGAARADPDLRQGLPGVGRRCPRCTRWRTSPAAGWPPTWRGCCPRSWWPRSSAAPGPRHRSSTWSGRSAAYPSPTSRRRSTAASAWSPCSSPARSTRRSALLHEHGISAWVAGEVAATDGSGGRVDLVGQHPGW